MKRCRLKHYNFQIKNKMENTKQTTYQPHTGNDFIADVSTRTLDENEVDVYCIGCGMDEQDGAYKYHRTVANGDEWYCTNCKDYHLH